MRSIAEILQKVRESYDNSDHYNGFYVTSIITGDHGSLESTTSVVLGFTGFEIEFYQDQWMVNSDDTLYLWPKVIGIEGIESAKVAFWANETAEAMRQFYFEGQMERAIIKQAKI